MVIGPRKEIKQFRDHAFMSHEVGSLRKLTGLNKAELMSKVSMEEIEEVRDFMRMIKYGNEIETLTEILEASTKQDNHLDNFAYRQLVRNWKVSLNVMYKVSTGLDVIDAGEWLRREMYQHVIKSVESNIKLLNHVRSFDYNFYRPALYNKHLAAGEVNDIYLLEYMHANRFSDRLKVCVTGFNTMAEWTIRGTKSFESLMYEWMYNVIGPEVKHLLNEGCNWIQIDEPALGCNPSHMKMFADCWNDFITYLRKDGMRKNTKITLHNCYSDYKALFDMMPYLNHLDSVSLEFANRDSWALGRARSDRTAYYEYEKEILESIYRGYGGTFALGVIDVHSTTIPSQELIRDRLLATANMIGDPKKVWAAPDCGLRPRPLRDAWCMLHNLSNAAVEARNYKEDYS